jgi:hypothetical protein
MCRQPDRSRMMSLLKFIMLMLLKRSRASKYVHEILRYLVHQECLMSPKEAHKTFYRQFVNMGNSYDSHIPADLEMEHLVNKQKRMIKHMFASKTVKKISRRSASLAEFLLCPQIMIMILMC